MPTHTRLTADCKRRILELYLTKIDGHWPTSEAIAEQVGCSHASVQRCIASAGIARQPKMRVTEAEREQIIAEFATWPGSRWKFVTEIAPRLNRSATTIYNILNRHAQATVDNELDERPACTRPPCTLACPVVCGHTEPVHITRCSAPSPPEPAWLAAALEAWRAGAVSDVLAARLDVSHEDLWAALEPKLLPALRAGAADRPERPPRAHPRLVADADLAERPSPSRPSFPQSSPAGITCVGAYCAFSCSNTCGRAVGAIDGHMDS